MQAFALCATQHANSKPLSHHYKMPNSQPEISILPILTSQNTFGLIDHSHLLAIMLDLGDPQDANQLNENIYSHSTTSFQGTHFTKTSPIRLAAAQYKEAPLAPTYLSSFYNLSSIG